MGEAARLGIRLAKGVELDCRLGERNLHLLAYGIDERYPVFQEIEEEILAQERRCSARRLEIFHENGTEIRRQPGFVPESLPSVCRGCRHRCLLEPRK